MRFRLLPSLFAGGILILLSVAGTFGQSEEEAEEKKEETLPLAASDTLSFTVTEGTWMSLDVSPDGQTIVFELLGDLYTLPIGGGEGHPDHRRAVLREPAGLFSGRRRDRVPQRPERRREPLDRER